MNPFLGNDFISLIGLLWLWNLLGWDQNLYGCKRLTGENIWKQGFGNSRGVLISDIHQCIQQKPVALNRHINAHTEWTAEPFSCRGLYLSKLEVVLQQGGTDWSSDPPCSQALPWPTGATGGSIMLGRLYGEGCWVLFFCLSSWPRKSLMWPFLTYWTSVTILVMLPPTNGG